MSKHRRKKIPSTEVNATVQKLSHDGRGITKINDKTTFVFGALPQEEVKLKYTAIHGSYDEAEAVDILTSNPERVTPHCQHFGLCGGCQMQHLAADAQIQHKQSVLMELLSQQGLAPLTLLPPISANKWGYRRKARLGVKFVRGKDKVLVGFRERNGRFLANLSQCEVLHPHIGHRLDALSQLFYQLDSRETIPQLEVAIDDQETAIILRHLKPLSKTDLEKLHTFCKENQFVLYLQPKGPDTIRLSSQSKRDPFLHYALPAFNLRLAFQPQQFTQINFEINQQMIDKALTLLDLNQNDVVLDLFCGIGNFSLPIAKKAKWVVGVEGDETAVTQARFNAIENNLTHCDFITANLFEDISAYAFSKTQYNKVLIDPPRTGALEVLPHIVRFKPEKILYISCNPSTLARDAKYLVQAGYTLKCAGIMDMFPHTKHVEAMALFERK